MNNTLLYIEKSVSNRTGIRCEIALLELFAVSVAGYTSFKI